MASKPISKEQIERRETYVAQLNDLGRKVQEAANAYNEVMEEMNTALENVREWRDDVVGSLEDYIDNKSDKWQESDKGLAWTDLKNEWEGAELDEFELLDVSDIPDDEFGSRIADLQQEPDLS
jgi:seryl-tRNA synthetase